MTGQELKIIRKKFRLTLEELGELFGVSAAAVSRWETEHRPVPTLPARILDHMDETNQIPDFLQTPPVLLPPA